MASLFFPGVMWIHPRHEEHIEDQLHFAGLPSGNPLQTRQPPDRCDVLLVTATKVETQAVLKRLWQQERRDPFRCRAGSNTYLDLGMIGGARTLLVQSGQGAIGADGATLIVQEGIRTFSPSAVMVLGIAFGLRPDKQSLGEIIVSSQLRAYEAQRIGTDIHGKLQIILRGPRADASPYLLDKFRIGELDWSEIRVHTGLFLSGEKLIDHEEVRDHLLSLEPEAIGGDMEGADSMQRPIVIR